ncbi:RNA polymerase sigma factor [Allorhodopirellula heiligendammensis]|uniref:RNA polymerase sigma factor CnrH n=1 Tax=Allorhodopirellula heiligendammensis TaxID=2714739 RepID=A0A5C6C1U6_9BACT|nr:sigma-70 family RNA polymerase sigma factor [Allorhodopirellula heiligendammensis]TWU18132.1 RNA polymerase sigma factor CnrH [Allorhodopirellula heiligendammensis]
MSESPPTRATLLLRLRNHGDGDAWREFLRDYGPMIYRFVRRRGLQDADASDLVQDVMRSVAMAINRLEYEKEKGGFRAWLFTITRNKLSTYFEKRNRLGPIGNDSGQYKLLGQVSGDDGDLEQQWELEFQRQLAAIAMESVKLKTETKTWMAFELTAMKGLSAEEAGDQIGMSKGAVYVARSRVTAKLRIEIERLLAEEKA